MFAVCGHCGRGIVATLEGLPFSPSPMEAKEFSNESYRLLETAPAPPHAPGYAAECFRQGAENLPRNPDAAGAMFRKALEVGLEDEYPEIGGSLKKRIELAAAEGHLTRELAAWADQIRLDGNEAVHGKDSFSQEDASRLHEFTRLVFYYLFSLPRMLERARGAPAGQG